MSQRTIEIHYIDFETRKFQHVANFVSDKEDVESALEDAFRYTQNIEGSWSQGFTIPGRHAGELEDNGDYNPNITVIAPLPTHAGKTYAVGSFGFDPVEE